jgi:hypothetical protein
MSIIIIIIVRLTAPNAIWCVQVHAFGRDFGAPAGNETVEFETSAAFRETSALLNKFIVNDQTGFK